jgi:hypothetical protein
MAMTPRLAFALIFAGGLVVSPRSSQAVVPRLQIKKLNRAAHKLRRTDPAISFEAQRTAIELRQELLDGDLARAKAHIQNIPNTKKAMRYLAQALKLDGRSLRNHARGRDLEARFFEQTQQPDLAAIAREKAEAARLEAAWSQGEALDTRRYASRLP